MMKTAGKRLHLHGRSLRVELDRYQGIGLSESAEVDWPSLMQYKKGVIGFMPQAMEITETAGLKRIRKEQ